jgi:isoleucyl-tRNA synthetase
MKAASAQIERLSSAELARLRAGESLRIEVDGEWIELLPEDVLVQVQTTASFDVEADGQLIVWLDTQLDDELIAEGFAREAVNRLNAQRKALEFAVEQRIVLLLTSDSALLRSALERHAKLIAAETLATHLEVLEPGAFAARASAPVEFDLGAGHVLRAVLQPF